MASNNAPFTAGLIPFHKSSFANLPNPSLLRCLGSHALGPCHCRFLSDAVTGVTIVIILFFFPSQRPSLKWWFDFKGKAVKAGVWVDSARSWSMVISGLEAGPTPGTGQPPCTNHVVLLAPLPLPEHLPCLGL